MAYVEEHTPEQIAAHNAEIDSAIATLTDKIQKCEEIITLASSLINSLTESSAQAVETNSLLESFVSGGIAIGDNCYLDFSNKINGFIPIFSDASSHASEKIEQFKADIAHLQTQYW